MLVLFNRNSDLGGAVVESSNTGGGGLLCRSAGLLFVPPAPAGWAVWGINRLQHVNITPCASTSFVSLYDILTVFTIQSTQRSVSLLFCAIPLYGYCSVLHPSLIGVIVQEV